MERVVLANNANWSASCLGHVFWARSAHQTADYRQVVAGVWTTACNNTQNVPHTSSGPFGKYGGAQALQSSQAAETPRRRTVSVRMTKVKEH